MKIHPKRGLLVDKSVHENSPYENVNKNSPILKKCPLEVIVHEMSPSHFDIDFISIVCADKTLLAFFSIESKRKILAKFENRL
jgi:hypothetical protein